MTEWARAFLLIVMLAGGLVAVPIAYLGRNENKLRFRFIAGAAGLYVISQIGLFAWIFWSLRYSNRDWLHALFLPFFLGLAFTIALVVLWLLTRKRHDV